MKCDIDFSTVTISGEQPDAYTIRERDIKPKSFNLALSDGKRWIVVDLKTGEVSTPEGLELTEASRLFWERLKQFV